MNRFFLIVQFITLIYTAAFSTVESTDTCPKADSEPCKQRENPYPTRISGPHKIVHRVDPVIWQDWSPEAPISREQYDDYEKNGFLILPELFSEAEIAEINKEATRLIESNKTLEPETLIFESENYKTSLRTQYIGVPSPEIVTEFVNKYGLEIATGKAGTVILFDSNTLHGSNGNITPWPRHNAFIVYCAQSNALEHPYETETPRAYFAANRDKEPETF